MVSAFARLVGHAAVVDALQEIAEQWGGKPAYGVGTNVPYGRHLEFGTRKMPAYPWLLPAVNEIGNDWAARIVQQSGSSAEAVERIALLIERQAKLNSDSNQGGRSPGTHPEHPTHQTGNLKGSIKTVEL